MEPPGEEGGRDFFKSLAEQKLRSFSIGNMGPKRTLSKKEQEEMKKKQDQVRLRFTVTRFIRVNGRMMDNDVFSKMLS